MFYQLWPGQYLNETSVRLQTYSKQPVVIMGTTEVRVSYLGQEATLPLVVVKNKDLHCWAGTGYAKSDLTGARYIMLEVQLTSAAERLQ